MQGDNTFGLRVRHKRVWLNSLGAQWVNDLEVGTTMLCAPSSTSRSTSTRRCSRRPTAASAARPQDVFREGRKVAEYDVLDERAGVDLGYALGNWGELRVGPQLRPPARRPDGGAARRSR